MSALGQQPQAAAKKGKKKKGTTLSLTDFLGDAAPAPAPVVKNLDWADETEDFDGADFTYQSTFNNKQILSSLPTGPRSSRNIEVDLTKLPNEPPYTAFVGNLPYEADDEMLAEFFKDLKILSVRLPEENGRFKGYGYVEFPDRHSLAEALQHNEETFNKRQIRVDVAGSKNQDNRRGGNNRYTGLGFGSSGFDGPDMTEGDWRRGPTEEFKPPQPTRGYGESGYRSDRGGEPLSRRKYGGFGDSEYRSDRGGYERGGDSSSRYGGGRSDYGDRGYGYRDYQSSNSYGQDYGRSQGGRDSDRSYGGGGGYSRDRGYDDRSRDNYGRDQGYSSGSYGGDRGYGRDRQFGSDQGYGGSRGYGRDQGSSYDRRSYGGGGYRDSYESRDSGRYQGGSSGYDSRSRNDDDMRSRGQDYYGSREPERRRPEEGQEEPQPRRQLKLQPRTKPLEESAPAPPSTRSSIFGGAKPVDTASREKQIEEKLRQEQETVFHTRDERDSYTRAPRRTSERSDDSHPSSPRRIVRRISSDKDHQEGPRRRSTSPGHQNEGSTSSTDQRERDYRPAPAPKQSAWVKRTTPERNQGEQRERKTSGSEDSAESKKVKSRPAPAPTTNQWSRGPPKIESRGVREEAEGDSRDYELNQRTPEGADDTSRGSDGSAGDGSERRRVGPDRNSDAKPRQHGDGSRDGGVSREPPRRASYENQSDFRRRGDGGSGHRRDWDRDRPARGYEGGRGRPLQGGDERNSRGDTSKSKGGNDKRRDSSRDSRPECDRSAAVGQEQDFQRSSASKGRRQHRPSTEPETEPAIEFVQKSKFSALAIEGEENEGHVTNGDDDAAIE